MIKLLKSLFVVPTLSLLCSCALPHLEDRTSSSALPVHKASETRMASSLAPQLQAKPGQVGIYPLQDPREAYASRVALVRNAERTVDIQSYLWRNDTTGNLILNELLNAADRGVRVRLLIDDNGVSGLDDKLNAVDAHPNIEVRLFNPFVIRKPKWLGYLTDFKRANRRMHNKTFTVDNQVTIAGGRNIGDEYFGATVDTLFTDLDVLCIGEVVRDVSADFDAYWQSDSAYPVVKVLVPTDQSAIDLIKLDWSQLEQSEPAARYVTQVRESAFFQKLMNGSLPLHWATARMVSDDPAKGLDQANQEDLLVGELRDFIGQPEQVLNVVSPYFVPTEKGVAFFSQLAQQGVKVQILTNSLEATDVAAVHSGYAKSRVDLLKAGVKLFEMRKTPRIENVRQNKRNTMLGSSGSSLHTKMFSVDGNRVFVGSFNFDPRSVNLNTEMGFLINSKSLAVQIDRDFKTLPTTAYEVILDEQDSLVWIEREGEKLTKHELEPKATVWRRVVVFFFSLLPINDLL
ncbi:putative cardiolipin synthase [Limnobacter thiooxidans]|uniref:Phospholipase D family protein n=1 Tax=Limnobacter thiooxidans TaxID=131080 RepID=A0AA86ME86_9BURK|nr:phospholipase D family protein [Limnobacter sp.]MCZ8015850.1 phospholipase D family protein [Limnobacter sp.]RZS42932.1 putative cardiolipin synthase [Limnobacter thiooxidans]BET25630.1 phospholipase D family protein [Limnobacter thiooxidans]